MPEDAPARDDARTEPSAKRTRGVSRRRALGALATVGIAATAGCSLPSLSLGMQPVWVRELEAASRVGPPAATADHVLVGAQDKHLHGFGSDGDRAFTYQTGGPIDTQPAVPTTGGPVHVQSTDGDLYTVSLDGEQLWTEPGQAEHRWLARRGSLLVGIERETDTITGYDAHDGTRRFQYPRRGYHPPTLTDTVCILPRETPGGAYQLRALDPATGDARWETPTRDVLPNVATDGTELATAPRSVVRLHRTRDGSQLWETEIPGRIGRGFQSPLWLDTSVYVHVERRDQADQLVALDRSDGRIRWRQPVGYELERVVPTADAVFAASSVDDPDGGIVVRLDAFEHDGTRRWQTTTDIPTGGRVDAFGRTGNVLYAAGGTTAGAYDPTTGERRWRHDPDSYNIAITATDDALYASHQGTAKLARLPTT
ncbi:outer membrane protein assembly factor BamB family protein [Halorubellus salinus]|uniref:outer membrane protein assembly factor BamB family protein n=1 Tax=Halorubellus salinus TaxID=755309 RepID=UPI001D06F5C1|nr:PQQ-binding-like beta-propeller repeat protein [Halorubellus salinus]